MEALYASDDDLASTHENTLASPELPIINNPIRSKTVGLPKKERIRSEKKNVPAVKKNRGQPKKNLVVPTQNQIIILT